MRADTGTWALTDEAAAPVVSADRYTLRQTVRGIGVRDDVGGIPSIEGENTGLMLERGRLPAAAAICEDGINLF